MLKLHIAQTLLGCGNKVSIVCFSGVISPSTEVSKMLDQYLVEVVELLSL